MDIQDWVILFYAAFALLAIGVFLYWAKTAPIVRDDDEFAGFKNTDLLFAPTDPHWNHNEEVDPPLHDDGGSAGDERLPSRSGPDAPVASPYHGSISYARTYACSCVICKYLRSHIQ